MSDTHVCIETVGCGEIIAPVEHVTLHSFGGKCRMLVRGDDEWREIERETYEYLRSMLEYL